MTTTSDLPSKSKNTMSLEDMRLALNLGMVALGIIGATFAIFSITYLHDLTTLQSLPNLVWDFVCGVPVEGGIGLPLLISLSAISLMGMVSLGLWRSQLSGQRLAPPRRVLAIFALGMIFTGAVIFGVVMGLNNDSAARTYAETVRTDGVRPITPPRDLMDFTLPDQTGNPFSLSQLSGNYALLYFGYTHCPDVCLLTLSEIQAVRDLLGDSADDLAYVFISVDGERDTADILTRYFRNRRVTFMIGLTGDVDTLARITPDYGLAYRLNKETADANGNYSVDHTANLYLVDPQGRLVSIFAYGTAPEAIAEFIREQLS